MFGSKKTSKRGGSVSPSSGSQGSAYEIETMGGDMNNSRGMSFDVGASSGAVKSGPVGSDEGRQEAFPQDNLANNPTTKVSNSQSNSVEGGQFSAGPFSGQEDLGVNGSLPGAEKANHRSTEGDVYDFGGGSNRADTVSSQFGRANQRTQSRTEIGGRAGGSSSKVLLILALAVFILALIAGAYYYFFVVNSSKKADVSLDNSQTQSVNAGSENSNLNATTGNHMGVVRLKRGENLKDGLAVYLKNNIAQINGSEGLFVRAEMENSPLTANQLLSSLGISLGNEEIISGNGGYLFISQDASSPKISLILPCNNDLDESTIIEMVKGVESQLPLKMKGVFIDDSVTVPGDKESITFLTSSVDSRFRFYNYSPDDSSKSIDWGVIREGDNTFLVITTSKDSTKKLITALEKINLP